MRGRLNLLVDTHILLWTLSGSKELDTKVEQALKSPRNVLWVSSISIWEIAIKSQICKLTLPHTFVEAIQAQGMQVLPFDERHALATLTLPLHHRDPFDRALVAQCTVESCTLVTADDQLFQYKSQIKILRA